MVEKSQYKSLKEWQKSNIDAYKDAISQNYINTICEMFGWEKYVKEKGNGYWDLNRCLESAKGLTKTEWRKKFNSAYQSAIRNGWMDKCEEVLLPTKLSRVNTKSECHEIALKYTLLKCFIEKEPKIYDYARRYRWLPEITSHMIRGNTNNLNYTKEECINSARNFKFRSEWTKKESSYYGYAWKMGWLNDCCSHMVRKSKWNSSNIWIEEICLSEAKKFETEIEWEENSNGSYLTAKKYKIIENCTKHMG